LFVDESFFPITRPAGRGAGEGDDFYGAFDGAEEAKQMGLLFAVLPDHAALMVRVEALAQLVASLAPLTLWATKEALRRLRMASVPAGSGILFRCVI
jgi:hypothetical protein